MTHDSPVQTSPLQCKRRRVAPCDSDSDSDHHRHTDLTPMASSVSSPVTEPEEPDHYEHKHKSARKQERHRDIIEQQFDLEILLKHRELRTIEDRIAQVHTLMVQMRKLHHDPSAKCRAEPTDFVKRYACYLRDRPSAAPIHQPPGVAPAGLDETLTPVHTSALDSTTAPAAPVADGPSRRIRHPTAKLASNGGYIGRGPIMQCIYRRTDGLLVRLVCQDCDRSNFGSAQGFINHCRISHARDYGSHDSAASACGVEIEDQDETGREALKRLGRSAIKPAAKPTVRDRSFSMSSVPSRMASVQLLQQQHAQQNTQQHALPQPIPAIASLPTPPPQFIPAPKPPTTFDNLEQLLRDRKIDVDFKVLLKTSMESVPKSHLFEDESESDEEENVELGEDATPFQRVIAEARKLKLDVDELIAQGKANGNRPSGSKPARRSSGFTKKKKGGSGGSGGGSAAAAAAAASASTNAAPTTAQTGPQTGSSTPSKPSRTASPIGSPSLRPSYGASPVVEDIKLEDQTSLSKSKSQAAQQPRRISISTPSTRSSTRAASCRAQQNEEEMGEGSHIVGQLSKFLSLDRFF